MESRNRVVARRQDGGTIKGYTLDFTPVKQKFHISAPDDRTDVTEVLAADLKAVFYVKTFEGDPKRNKSSETAERLARETRGKKLKVTFLDGEVLYGTTLGYSPGRPGFFVTPVESASNNERAYVFAASTASVEPL